MTNPATTDPLANLADIHTSTVLISLLAWGWWLLILLAILVFVGLFIWQKKAFKQRANKKFVKQALQKLQKSNTANKIIEVSILLRRYAHYRFEEQDIKSKTSTELVAFLSQKLLMDEKLKIAFTQAVYQKNINNIDEDLLFAYAFRWLDV